MNIKMLLQSESQGAMNNKYKRIWLFLILLFYLVRYLIISNISFISLCVRFNFINDTCLVEPYLVIFKHTSCIFSFSNIFRVPLFFLFLHLHHTQFCWYVLYNL